MRPPCFATVGSKNSRRCYLRAPSVRSSLASIEPAVAHDIGRSTGSSANSVSQLAGANVCDSETDWRTDIRPREGVCERALAEGRAAVEVEVAVEAGEQRDQSCASAGVWIALL